MQEMQETQVRFLDFHFPEKEMATTPLFLHGKSYGQRSLAGYSPWGRKRVRHNLATKQHPWIQPTMDGFVLQYLLLKKNLHMSGPVQYKLCAFQDHLYMFSVVLMVKCFHNFILKSII